MRKSYSSTGPSLFVYHLLYKFSNYLRHKFGKSLSVIVILSIILSNTQAIAYASQSRGNDTIISPNTSSNDTCMLSDGTVRLTVDNSLGNGATHGCIIDYSGFPDVNVKVYNDHSFWTKIAVFDNLSVNIVSENAWAQFGYIPPNSFAEFHLRFDQTFDSRIMFFINAARSEDGRLTAGAFNIVSKILGVLGIYMDVANLDDLQYIFNELDAMDKSSHLILAANALGDFRLLDFLQEFHDALGDDAEINILTNIAAHFGKTVSVSAFKALFTAIKIIFTAKDTWESVWAIITGSYAGTVIFTSQVQSDPPPPHPNPTPPPLPSPLPNNDEVSFLSDITFPDGAIVSLNQSFNKTWRVKNTGTSTWTGYNLKFISNEPMGGPAEVAIPTTAPGGTVDISVNLVAPSVKGAHTGVWQIVNPSGTWVSGGQLTVVINVQTQSSSISLSTDPPSPADTSMVRIHAVVNGFSNFRALRIKIDGSSQYEIGAPEAYWNWNTSGYSIGQHSIVVEVADQTDASWSHPEVGSYLYTLTGTGASNNHAPNRPTLVQNPAYDWYVTIGNAPQLCAQSQGDPDNDVIASFHFVGTASVGTVDSGWVSGPCYTFGSITPGTYTWHVQVMDSRDGISDWSDSWHFTVEPTGVTAYIDHFSTASPSNAEQIKIYACSSGHAGVNITLRVLVNDANNGTDSGQWHIIKEQGSPCFNDTDAPVWNTLEYGDGSHLVRVVAMAIQPDAGSISDNVYVLNHRRPYSPSQIAPVASSGNPQDAVYLNSRAVTFQWSPTIRAQSYTLYVSTTSSPSTDPNPVFTQTFDSTVNQSTVNFSQNYSALYWQVMATNDIGSSGSNIQIFGLDQQAPSCIVSGLVSPTYSNVFQVNWNSSDDLAGVRTSDIQFMDSTRSTWEDWLTSTPFSKTYDLFNGQPGHTYFFRCRATDNANNAGTYPASADTSIMVDPFSQPGTPWWDQAYGQKRNIVVLNNMSGIPLPQGYPIHVHFDSTTTPTAATIYAGSLSNPACNDLRITYSDSVELDRIVQNCSSSNIDIWFRSQASVAAGSSDNTSYQLYYGNASAGAPPADPNQVWYPYHEADTSYLYFLQEGNGSTAYDYSGNNHNCSINSSVQWSASKFGYGLRFNRANSGDSRSLNCGGASPLSAFTVEFWYKPDSDDGGRIAGELSGGGNGGGGNNWLLQNSGGKIRLDTWPCSSCGSSDVSSNFNLTDSQYVGKWNHIAVTFNGSNEVRFYINGNLDSIKTLSQSGINSFTPPLEIGSAEGISQIKANLGAFRISNTVKTSFPYASFSAITNEPSVATDSAITPPVIGAPDLALLSLSTYPNPSGGVLVEAVVQNQGDLSTKSGFYTDLYLNHTPEGAGDYTNSVRFWINDPIDPGQIATLTTVITDVSSLSSASSQSKVGQQSAGAIIETSGMLFAQTDSAGAVTEPDKQNNIYSAGVQICTASSDPYESDNASASASLISVGGSQTHNFDVPGDGDWIKFNVQAGQTYLLTTSNLGVSADTYLYLYGTDGQTLLASNDDYNNSLASQIQWTATQSGTYYAIVKGWNPNSGGCGTQYSLSLNNYVAPPGDFNKTSPADGSTNQSASPTLSWTASTGATSYEYCYDTTNDNACSNWQDNGIATSKVLSGLAPNTTYYWHVRAVNAGGTIYSDGASTAFWSFTNLSNLPPTDLSLSNSSMAEGQPIGTTVGMFTTADPNTGDTFTYILVSGTGSTDNTSFSTTGNTLKTAVVFNYATKNSYSIRVRTTDQGGLYFEKAFTVSITNQPNIFTDVPDSYWAVSWIERLYNAGITGGCSTSPLMYCPDNTVTRAQMAVFLLKGIHGSSYSPPAASGTVFSDVPLGYWAASWVEQLLAEGITGGCATGQYCPENVVTRAQMAVFLLKAEHGSSYAPPSASGTKFSDVPLGYWAASWIEQLAAEGITSGCGGTNYCPEDSVTRAQMAVFLVKTFGLP